MEQLEINENLDICGVDPGQKFQAVMVEKNTSTVRLQAQGDNMGDNPAIRAAIKSGKKMTRGGFVRKFNLSERWEQKEQAHLAHLSFADPLGGGHILSYSGKYFSFLIFIFRFA